MVITKMADCNEYDCEKKKRTIEVNERIYQYLLYCRDVYFEDIQFETINAAIEYMTSEGFPRDEYFWEYLEEKGELYKYYPYLEDCENDF